MAVKTGANAVVFVLGALTCLLASANPWWLLAPVAILLVHFSWISSWAREGKLVVSVLLAGSALDSFLLQLGVFEFPGDATLIPAWLALLWALLGTTLNHCLAWTAKRWWLASLVGLVIGPCAYLLAQAWADLSLVHGPQTSLLILIPIWAAVLPLLQGFANLYQEQYRLRQLGRRPPKN